MSNIIILDKTYDFALAMVKFSQELISEKEEYVLPKNTVFRYFYKK